MGREGAGDVFWPSLAKYTEATAFGDTAGDALRHINQLCILT